jgi:hypothetical protein
VGNGDGDFYEFYECIYGLWCSRAVLRVFVSPCIAAMILFSRCCLLYCLLIEYLWYSRISRMLQ